MTARRTLPNRREHYVFAFQHDGILYTCGTGYFSDGALAEIFLSCAKPGSAAATAAQDAAVIASIALQYRTPISCIKHALTRLSNGEAAGPLGKALDLIEGSAYA
ncbi:MAG: hypothetical protein JO208_01365 [Alphaproteobacteria bacterium]|nr:hypothetical protein [Alphaproteobacteria bacterium]